MFVAIQQLLDHQQTSAPVVDESGKFIGIFSEKDCIEAVLEASYNQSNSGKVADFMNTETNSVSAESSIIDIAKKIHKLFGKNITCHDRTQNSRLSQRTRTIESTNLNKIINGIIIR